MDQEPDEIQEIRRFFSERIPAVANGVIELKSIARDPGKRTMVAVYSSDRNRCPVTAISGSRGANAKSLVNQLGEMIDVIRWSPSIEEFIQNALVTIISPEIRLDHASGCATVRISPGQRSLFLNGQPSRLALVSRLVGWEIQVEGLNS